MSSALREEHRNINIILPSQLTTQLSPHCALIVVLITNNFRTALYSGLVDVLFPAVISISR